MKTCARSLIAAAVVVLVLAAAPVAAACTVQFTISSPAAPPYPPGTEIALQGFAAGPAADLATTVAIRWGENGRLLGQAPVSDGAWTFAFTIPSDTPTGNYGIYADAFDAAGTALTPLPGSVALPVVTPAVAAQAPSPTAAPAAPAADAAEWTAVPSSPAHVAGPRHPAGARPAVARPGAGARPAARPAVPQRPALPHPARARPAPAQASAPVRAHQRIAAPRAAPAPPAQPAVQVRAARAPASGFPWIWLTAAAAALAAAALAASRLRRPPAAPVHAIAGGEPERHADDEPLRRAA